MPEGPSIVILKEDSAEFAGRKIRRIAGNTTVNLKHLEGKKLLQILSWGKHYLLCFDKEYIRIHFLLFGSYRINEQKENGTPRLSLFFDQGELHFYACSVKLFGGHPNDDYDWRTDTMSESWDKKLAGKRLKEKPEILICDALLDQEIFAGVGNIVKNEVLFRTKIHPLSETVKIPARKLSALIDETRNYCFDFYRWKRAFELKKHWLAHRKKICPRDGNLFTIETTGRSRRKSYFCPRCQVKYG